jgi:cardiolipin synthase
MIYEECLHELRAAGFRPRAWARFFAATARRVQLDVAANPGGARSFVVLGLVLFALAFAGCVALALLVNVTLARQILVWSGVWIAVISAILIACIDLLRDRDGYRLSAVNLPISITTARFCVVPAMALTLAAGHFRLAFWLYLIAAFSDVVDGWLARRSRQVTAMGRLMDPMVDLVFLLAMMWAMHVSGRIGDLVFALALVRYAGVIIGGSWLRFVRGPVRIHSTVPGKVSGLFIATGIGFLLLLPAYGGRVSVRVAPLAEDALAVLLAAGILHGAILLWINWRRAGAAAAAESEAGRVIRDVAFGADSEAR